MSRRLRYIPEERTLVEVTCRTVHGRYLLCPSRLLDALYAEFVGRAGVRRERKAGEVRGLTARQSDRL